MCYQKGPTIREVFGDQVSTSCNEQELKACFSSTIKVQNSMLVSLSPLLGCQIGKLVHICVACVQQLLLRPQEFCTRGSLKTEKLTNVIPNPPVENSAHLTAL